MKPFLKWAGGKKQLLKDIEQYYPFSNDITKYAEPFVGGGAVLFDILNKFDLEMVYISDVNAELINTYRVIRDNNEELIGLLSDTQKKYLMLETEDRKEYYLRQRERFNNLKQSAIQSNAVEKACLMIFLNKTCFNGLFRVNKKGYFNVPMGRYKNPMICDEQNLREISKKIQKVEIVCCDYRESADFIDAKDPLRIRQTLLLILKHFLMMLPKRSLLVLLIKYQKKVLKFWLAIQILKMLMCRMIFFIKYILLIKLKKLQPIV